MGECSKEKLQQNLDGPQSRFSIMVREEAVYQFYGDLDDGVSYSNSRFNIEVGPNYLWS